MWFLKHFERAFATNVASNVFMSNREKGLPTTLEKTMPNVTQAYCCQHIADNVQQQFGLKCQSLFWACARARSKEGFQDALKALIKQDVDAGNYVNSINHKLWTAYAFEYA